MRTDALTPLRRWAVRIGLVTVGVLVGAAAGHAVTGVVVGVVLALGFDTFATFGERADR